MPGLAFVLVQHLSPDHDSMLVDLLQRCTSLPVAEVRDGEAVQSDRVYVIPPGRDLALLNGRLQLLQPGEPRGHRRPIDFFFRSLAQDQRERAVGIVLSGSGSDGTDGLRWIKGEGGLALAQTPESADFDSMPSSAIATGLVDFKLPPREMAAELANLVRSISGRARRSVHVPDQLVGTLDKIIVLLRAQTGHDFSQYKPSTVIRRVERRTALHQLEDTST